MYKYQTISLSRVLFALCRSSWEKCHVFAQKKISVNSFRKVIVCEVKTNKVHKIEFTLE